MIDLLDLHTHTIASGHAYNTLYEMAQSAAEKGLAPLRLVPNTLPLCPEAATNSISVILT